MPLSKPMRSTRASISDRAVLSLIPDRWHKPLIRGLAAACLLSVSLAMAQTEPGADNEQRKRLVEQKMRLVELLINSPAAKSGSPEALDRSKSLLSDARQATNGGNFTDAARMLDEVLRNLSKSGKASGGEGSLSESAQRKQNDELREQIKTYRAAIKDLEKDAKQAPAARKLLLRVDALTAEGEGLAGENRHGDAGRKFGEAYRLAVEEISRMRAGQEVVMSLKFDTPADEFAYEQRRFASGEMLVASLIQEGRGEGDKRKMIDAWLNEARQTKHDGEAMASRREYREGIAAMEKATGLLNRALQIMGIPVF